MSKAAYFISPKACKLSAVLNKIPFSAPLPVPHITATGVASPNAQGHEITSTEIAKLNAFEIPTPAISHAIKVIIEITITAGTK